MLTLKYSVLAGAALTYLSVLIFSGGFICSAEEKSSDGDKEASLKIVASEALPIDKIDASNFTKSVTFEMELGNLLVLKHLLTEKVFIAKGSKKPRWMKREAFADVKEKTYAASIRKQVLNVGRIRDEYIYRGDTLPDAWKDAAEWIAINEKLQLTKDDIVVLQRSKKEKATHGSMSIVFVLRQEKDDWKCAAMMYLMVPQEWISDPIVSEKKK